MPALLLPPPSFCPKCLPSPKSSPSSPSSRDESARSSLSSAPEPLTAMASLNDYQLPPGPSPAKSNAQPLAELPEKLPSLLGPVTSFLYQHACSWQHEDSPQITPPATPDPLKDAERRERYAQRCPPRLTEYKPPANFGTVLDGQIFRSAFPKAENFPFLRSLGIKTILTLVPGPYEDDYVKFMEVEGIRHVHVHIPPNKGEVCVDGTEIIKALETVVNPKNFPLLIHCNKGKHRTGCVVGALRKCQGWSIRDIIGEYHVYATAKARLWDEVFLKFFNAPKAASAIMNSSLDGLVSETILDRSPLIDTGIHDTQQLAVKDS